MSTYSDGFTDRRRTRVYQRPADTTVVTRRDDFIGQTMAIEPKKKLFEGVSFAQVVAGAAAAATSVALASYIGIAGSIIGAAISSVVTVVSSQLYRRALDASARKIKIASAKAKTTMFAEQPDAPGMTANGGRGARIAPSELRERAATERRTTQRKVIAFSVIAAAVAVAACAGAILLGTAGEGIGEKTQVIPTPAISQTERQPVEQDEAPASNNTDDVAANAPASTDNDTAATDKPGASAPDTNAAPNTDSNDASGNATDVDTPSTDVAGEGSSGSTDLDVGASAESASDSTATDTSGEANTNGSAPSADVGANAVL